jgi:hypothetical protein
MNNSSSSKTSAKKLKDSSGKIQGQKHLHRRIRNAEYSSDQLHKPGKPARQNRRRHRSQIECANFDGSLHLQRAQLAARRQVRKVQLAFLTTEYYFFLNKNHYFKNYGSLNFVQ